MKKLLMLILLILGVSVIADPLFIPKTSDEQNFIQYMPEGSVAYVPNSDGSTARLLIGNGSSQPYPVMDPAVLRGKAPIEVQDNDISKVITTGISFANGIYSVDNHNPMPDKDPGYDGKMHETITITVEGRTISNITWSESSSDYGGRLGGGSEPEIKIEYTGSTAKMQWTQPPMSKGNIFNIKVYYIPSYMDYVNDTTKIDYIIKDSLGQYNLSKLRSYVIDYWKGKHQLATNWSEYVAYKDVKLNKNFVRWDNSNNTIYNTKFDELSEDLITYGKGIPMITIRSHGGETLASGSLSFTGINAGFVSDNGTVTLDFSESITGFDISKLELWITDYLETDRVNWIMDNPISVNYNSSTHSGTIVARARSTTDSGNMGSTNSRFYKLVYDSIETGIYQVLLRGQVIIQDQLILKSTSGNTFWRIKVNDSGVLSTEQVINNMPQ